MIVKEKRKDIQYCHRRTHPLQTERSSKPRTKTTYEDLNRLTTQITPQMVVKFLSCEVLPSLHNKASGPGAHPLYNNYMFAAASGKKIKAFKKEKNRKNRSSHHHQSVECIGRSYNNHKLSSQQQQQSQFLPEVKKSIKSHKSGSVARGISRKDDDQYNTNPIYETLSDDKFSQVVSSSEKESKEYFSSSHSRTNQTYRKSTSIYCDSTIENLRNLCKAEKELRGIFQSVKQYEFPIIKDKDGNIKLIGKYQPKKLSKNPSIVAPSRQRYNPIVFDRVFRGEQETNDNQLENIEENGNEENKNTNFDEEDPIQEKIVDKAINSQSQQQPECLENETHKLTKQWETSTIASSTFYSDNTKGNNTESKQEKNQDSQSQLDYLSRVNNEEPQKDL